MLNSGATTILPIILSTIILLVGVVDDLRSRKFHNWLFLVCSLVAFVAMAIVGGWTSLYLSTLGFGAGFIVLLPLVLLKMVGAGDMKLLAAFGIAAGWNAVISVAIMSLFWGAIFGVVRVIIGGQLRVLLGNMVAIVTPRGSTARSSLELHKIPFTIALLMGWLSHLVYQGWL